jgi:hypothetical protein
MKLPLEVKSITYICERNNDNQNSDIQYDDIIHDIKASQHDST